VKRRSCRDVPCLLIFAAFWAGMLYVAYQGFMLGDPQRIVYGVDSFGHYCGMVNTRVDGNVTTQIDLRNAKKLYYLNPLELLDAENYQYAKTVCVKECPGAAVQCAPTDFPCQSEDQYICPYYSFGCVSRCTGTARASFLAATRG